MTNKPLTFYSGLALALGINIGAGLLVLTGLVYSKSGGSAIYSWVIDGIMVLPVLAVLARFGSLQPSAEGVGGLARVAFGTSFGAGVQMLLLGTFSIGLPGIAIVGGNYFAFLVNGSDRISTMASIFILAFAGILNYKGARVSQRFQKALSFGLIFVLVCASVLALTIGSHHSGTRVSPLTQWPKALPTARLAFFAFTGWLLIASTVEDYKRPDTDYPRVVCASFVIVFSLCLFVALATQLTLPSTDPRLVTAPVAALLSNVLGPRSGKFVALLGVMIVMSNVNAAIWGYSRLVMASSRTGLLPRLLSAVSQKSEVPQNAILAVTALLVSIVVICQAGLSTLDGLLDLAGQNFFVLYLICILAFVKSSRSWSLRGGAVALAALYLLWIAGYGVKLIYPMFLITAGYLIVRWNPPALRGTSV